jgi:hypothetical protein
MSPLERTDAVNTEGTSMAGVGGSADLPCLPKH